MDNIIRTSILVFMACITGCSWNYWETAARTLSPDGKLESITTVTGGHATAPYSWDVFVFTSGAFSSQRKKSVLRVYKISCIWTEWKSNEELMIHIAPYKQHDQIGPGAVTIIKKKDFIRIHGRKIKIKIREHPEGFKNKLCYHNPLQISSGSYTEEYHEITEHEKVNSSREQIE